MQSDAVADFEALGEKLIRVLGALADPEQRASGSDAASIARARRMLGQQLPVGRVVELEADYALLGEALDLSFGSGAAAVAQERRMIRKMLDALRAPEGMTKVAELESFRAAKAAAAGIAGGRRKSRGGAQGD